MVKYYLVRMAALVGTVLLLAGGCTAGRPGWPAISETPTDVHVQGRWVWGELISDNVETEKTFYQEVFGWQYHSYGRGKDTYTLIRANGRPIGGIVHYARPADAQRSARWLPFMSVPDVKRAADLAAAFGGKTLVPPKHFPGRGEVAVLEDPEGAIFGVIHAPGGDPPDVLPSYNTWFWLELWAKDGSRMADFYRPIGAYTMTRQDNPGDRPELRLMANGYPRAAILELNNQDYPSTWLPYVRVRDLQETLAIIVRAGGSILVDPSPGIRDGKVAVFIDPLGAEVAVAEWKDEGDEEAKP